MPFLTNVTKRFRSSAMNELMDQERLDALAFVTSEFYTYVTNTAVDVSTYERPIIAVMPRNGAPFAVVNELSTNLVRAAKERGMMWIDDVTIYSEHRRKSNGRLPVTLWPEMVADLLRARGLQCGRIGLDADDALMRRVAALCSDLTFVPAGESLSTIRRIKCEEEIDVIRHACALADWGQNRYREEIRPGRLVHELDLFVTSLIAEEAARRFPGEDLGWWIGSFSGPASASPHGDAAQTGAKVESGHVVLTLVCPRLNGLECENERTFFVGAASERQRSLFEAARAANEAGMAAAKAGSPISAIDAAAQDVIERHGFGQYILHRTGHGMGVSCHEYPLDMPFNDRPLLPGEVYSVEPGIYVYGLGGFRIDDSIVIRDNQPEILTKTPRDLAFATIRGSGS